MTSKEILNFPTLEEGILLKRYKRFLADIELLDGQIITAHCANTGPMKGILLEGAKVRIKYNPSPKRKLDWSWEQAEVALENGTSCWVGVNTFLANKLAKAAIESGFLLDQLGSILEIKNEVPYGIHGKSRIDMTLKPDISNKDQREIYIEVKNTTWAKGPIALFPDTVTKRGQKHLQELMSIMPAKRGVLIPCISRNDSEFFAPGESVDPLYSKLFQESLQCGLEVYPCCFGFYSNKITWEGIRPLTFEPK